MKKVLPVLLASLLSYTNCFSQAGMWTWMKGDVFIHPPAVFGTQGIPAITNKPPGLYGAASFVDQAGNLWLFAGNDGFGGSYNTLWKYTIADNTWTWMKGSSFTNAQGLYGTMGVPAAANTPGARAFGFFHWTDQNGDFWIYGGSGYNNSGSSGNLGDLWRYTVSTNEWTWMAGSTFFNANPIYGTLGMPAPGNTPGYRIEGTAAWTDVDDNLWFYGGGTYGSAHNDVWKFDKVLNQWSWMAGSSSLNLNSNYGTKGVYASTNTPGGRLSYCRWVDLASTFWYFGGGENLTKADLWQYDPSINQWRWVSGTSSTGSNGVYDTLCASSVLNYPSARSENRAAWTDQCGRLWLFGGGRQDINGDPTKNDLWVFDIVDTTWTWVKGDQGNNNPGIWGTMGVPDPANKPGAKEGTSNWVDLDGNLWLFGGGTPYWSDATNDLWRFVIDYTCPASASCNFSPPIAGFTVNDSQQCNITCLDFFDTTSNNPTSWQWSFPGSITPSSTLQNPSDICYSTAGTYDVTLIASNPLYSDTITSQVNISILTSTVITITQNGNQLTCNPPLNSYQWSFNSNPISGATNQTIIVSQTGLYEVTGTDANGCLVTDTINVTDISQVSFASTDTLICQKFCMDFFDQSSNNPTSWLWSFAGGIPSTSTDQNPTNICYNNPGVFDVTLITTSASGNDTLTLSGFITVYSTPPFPVITQNGNFLTSSAASSYQWQFNSIDIPGATNQSYTATQTGFYTIFITDSNGCNNSATLFVEVTGIEDIPDDFGFTIYPNPADGSLTLEWNNGNIETVEIRIYNMLGQLAFFEKSDIHANQFSKYIDITELPSAVYTIKLSANSPVESKHEISIVNKLIIAR